MSFICRPSRPPAALASSTASVSASTIGFPYMSKPPERSWMLATLIGSSAQALGPNMPAAAAAAVPCRNFLRSIFIAVFLLDVADASGDQILFQADAPIPAAVGTSFGPARGPGIGGRDLLPVAGSVGHFAGPGSSSSQYSTDHDTIT